MYYNIMYVSVLFACKLYCLQKIVLIHRPHGSTVLCDNIIKMVSGTDEPLSVGSYEPHFSTQFDINLNGYNIYLENRCLNTLEL